MQTTNPRRPRLTGWKSQDVPPRCRGTPHADIRLAISPVDQSPPDTEYPARKICRSARPHMHERRFVTWTREVAFCHPVDTKRPEALSCVDPASNIARCLHDATSSSARRQSALIDADQAIQVTVTAPRRRIHLPWTQLTCMSERNAARLRHEVQPQPCCRPATTASSASVCTAKSFTGAVQRRYGNRVGMLVARGLLCPGHLRQVSRRRSELPTRDVIVQWFASEMRCYSAVVRVRKRERLTRPASLRLSVVRCRKKDRSP
jgi:hypothetical protein